MRFQPRLLETLRNYSTQRFTTDVMAGLTVGVVALSLCIGLGIASGATPAAGLYAGIIGGFVIAALGGTRVQIGGPAGAFVGLIALTIAERGFSGLLVCTLMAGAIMIVMGLFRLGSLIRFVPHPVTMGFTCGIAITIMTTQIRPLLGLSLQNEPAEFLPRMVALFGALSTMHWQTVLLGAICLVIVFGWPKRWARVPGSIVAVILGTVLVAAFGWPTETIGSRYGGIPQGLPPLAWPEFDWTMLNELMRPAVTIALLGAVESLMSAVVADGLIDDQHDSNQELMAQGAANMIVPFFGGLPVTGVIARTATNIRSGATSPVAGIVHATFLLIVLLVAAPLATDIPLVALAAVLIAVAWRMGDWEEFALLRRRPKSDSLVFITTFALTVCFDLSIAVEVGMLLAAFLFIKRISDTTQVQAMAGEGPAPTGTQEEIPELPRHVLVYRVFGALLFGAAEKLDMVLRRSTADARVIILHMASVTALDATALNRLETLHEKLRRHGKHLILSGPHTQPYFVMDQAGFLEAVGMDNVAPDLNAAIERAKTLASAGAPSKTGGVR